MSSQASILGLDVGTVWVGLAKAYWPNGIASPYGVLANNDEFNHQLLEIIKNENVRLLVVGRPRGLNSQETNQTAFVDSFIRSIKSLVHLPTYSQDEALTSRQAETELKSRGKPYTKGDIDSLSATYILEDFMNEHPKGAGID